VSAQPGGEGSSASSSWPGMAESRGPRQLSLLSILSHKNVGMCLMFEMSTGVCILSFFRRKNSDSPSAAQSPVPREYYQDGPILGRHISPTRLEKQPVTTCSVTSFHTNLASPGAMVQGA